MQWAALIGFEYGSGGATPDVRYLRYGQRLWAAAAVFFS